MSELRPQITIGYRIGMLTVYSKTSMKKSGYTVWLCRCDCGGEIALDTRYLQRGTVTDCGCMTKVKPGMLDLTGKRFGKLVCLHLSDEKDVRGNTQWVCQCDCGNTCIAALPQLQAGYKKSCGCLSHPPLKDYIGKRFGQLTVLAYAGKQKGMHQWRCKCDCGNEAVIGQTRLQNGKTKSCGCLQATAYQRNPGIIDGTNVGTLEYYKTHLSPFNTSGYNGVSRNEKNDKWSAHIGFKGKNYNLGNFSNIEDAIAARQRAEEMHDEFLREFYLKNPDWRKKDKNMNKKELITEIAQKTEFTQKDTEKFLEAFCVIIAKELQADGKVQIIGFGSFETKERSARTGKNPRTGEAIEIPAAKLPSFKPGKLLKEMVSV